MGDSALHVASRARELPTVRLLLDLGADRSLVNFEARTAEGEARDLGFADLADWMATTRAGRDHAILKATFNRNLGFVLITSYPSSLSLSLSLSESESLYLSLSLSLCGISLYI